MLAIQETEPSPGDHKEDPSRRGFREVFTNLLETAEKPQCIMCVWVRKVYHFHLDSEIIAPGPEDEAISTKRQQVKT
jgi:hypothetical protein